MTTAHRPTWNNALGGDDAGGNRKVAVTQIQRARDLPAHKVLKTRKIGQNSVDEVAARDLKQELFDKERKAAAEKRKAENPFPEDADDDDDIQPAAIEDDSSNDSEDDSDDEDEDELLRELEKIKAERAEEQKRKEEEEERRAAKRQKKEVAVSNPLVGKGMDASLERSWVDDTVFKNQAKTKPKEKQKFTNDFVRSDFHRKFLNKYIG